MQKYTRLTEEERWQIAVHRQSGKSIGWIARSLERCFSTISRELHRNSTRDGKYTATIAQEQTQKRAAVRNQDRRKAQGMVLEQVHQKLKEYWSPVQISGWLKAEQNIQISHETIYKTIVYDPCHAWYLRDFLRHGRRKYQRRGCQKYAGRGYIPDRRDIDERPSVVNEKSRIGDWELDTIVGEGHNGYLVSMVERYSKYTLLVRVANSKAHTVKTAILSALGWMKDKVLTLTADNGKEFSAHQEIAAALNADFFFAKPYHAWERGLNEHTNGLIRQFFPKKTNFLNITDQQVQHVQNLLNSRPRKALNFKTPQQVFAPT
jgi:transposase, IS30 family